MKAVLIAAAVFTAAMLPAQTAVPDEGLAKILAPGEGWTAVASGLGMTDAACPDAEGNLYFSDIGNSIVYKLDARGQRVAFLEGGFKVSGLKFGPDGSLYACTIAPKMQVIAIMLPSKETVVLADNVNPNDLIVSKDAFVYFTETVKKQVTGIDIKNGKVFVAATNLNAPNGITLSPDGLTLAVSEYRGTNVWVYQVGKDGHLSSGKAYMTLATPPGRPISAGDGMTVDAAGRYYVTSAIGIQVFEPNGKAAGVIPRPQEKGTVSCAFAGPKSGYLYACSADKLYRRKMLSQGAWLFPAK
jgi:sugar lactone lactonase YvrE